MKIQELRGAFASFSLKRKQNFTLTQNQTLADFKPKFNSLKTDTVSFLARAYEKIPVYVTPIDGSEIARYDDINIAANRISTSRDNIQNQLKGKSRKTDGRFIFYAKDIDLLDENGNPVLDENGQPKMDKEKFDKLYREKLDKLKHKTTAVYIVSIDGTESDRFDSPDLAADKLTVGVNSVLNQMNNRRKSVKGFFIIKAQDVEKRNQEGNFDLDEALFDKIYQAKLEALASIKKGRKKKTKPS